MAALDHAITDELLAKLTNPREGGLKGVIKNVPPARPSTLNRSLFIWSLGSLDGIPTELLLCILDMLDFQTLSRFSRVSFVAKSLVEGMSAYKDMMQYAPSVLTALGRTKLLRHHSSAALRQALRSEKCVSCFDFGGFLFLPTCERICLECMRRNHAFWVMPLDMAEECFGLTASQLVTLPIMHTTPSKWVRRYSQEDIPHVSVKQSKELAIEVHGSVEEMHAILPEGSLLTTRKWRTFVAFHEAPLRPPGVDLSKVPNKHKRLVDMREGLASIRFPYVTEEGADWGRLCLGCFVICHKLWRDGVPEEVINEHAPPGVHPRGPFLAMWHRLWTRERFPEHVRRCYGVKHLLAEEQSLNTERVEAFV